MDDQKQRLLDHFVDMYGSRAVHAVQAYKKSGVRHVILAQFEGNVKPDMELSLLSRHQVMERFNSNSLTARLLIKQMDTLNPEVQAPIGLLLSEDEVLTHVVEFRRT